MAKVSGGRVRGRPRLGWMDGVKVALGNRGITTPPTYQGVPVVCGDQAIAWWPTVPKVP